MELPEFYRGGYFNGGAAKLSPGDKPTGGDFTVEDLLDFSNEDPFVTTAADGGGFHNPAAESSAVTAVDSCNSSVSGGEPHFSGNRSFDDSQFSGDLCVPCDDLAELEWLSNFVEDSFAADKDLQSLQFLSVSNTTKPQTPETCSSSETPQNALLFPSETPLPGKARSKRSRAAPGDWSTRLLHLITPNNNTKPPKATLPKKRDAAIVVGNSNSGSDSSGRKCLHCAAEKTPQWRTGPLGPKTLCNACGVRYKSGRLVPEYRPAASPTFVSARHSNSHRKVLELRRQKEVQRSHHHHHQFLSPGSIFGVSNGGHDDYLIHHHSVNDFRQMM